MKRSRFDNLVPETPENFHISLLDALGRMEAVRRRRQQRRRKAICIAASVFAVFALGAALFAALNIRPAREDAVVAPQEAALQIREDVSFRINNHYDERENYVLDWTVESTYEETVLYEYEVRLINRELGEVGFSDVEQWPKNMALLGTEAAGHALEKTVRQENWLNCFRGDAGDEGNRVDEILISVNFYRPTAEFCNNQAEAFENASHWAVFETESGPEAYAGNQCVIVDGERRFDETEMTILDDYYSYQSDKPAQSAEEAWAQMREYARLKRTALKMYGYGEWLKGYEVCIDLTGETPTTDVKEVLQ